MRKILLSGDLHIKKGIFVSIGLDYLDYVHNYCRENDIFDIVFLGDIFEKSAKIYNEAFVPVFKKLMVMSEIFTLTFILGNHDIYSIDMEDSITQTFGAFGKVITHNELTDDDIELLSYTKNEVVLNEFLQEVSTGPCLLTHLAIASFKFDNDYHVNEKIAFKPELFHQYKIVFSGHFHHHQHKGNIVYVGSPFQTSFGEEGQKKGFVVLDAHTLEWEFLEYNKAPKHITVSTTDLEDINNINFKNKFVKLKIEKKIDEYVKLKYILYEQGALDIVPDFQSSKVEIERDNSNIDINSSIESIVREHIGNIKDDRVNNIKIMKIFEKVLNEI